MDLFDQDTRVDFEESKVWKETWHLRKEVDGDEEGEFIIIQSDVS